MLKSSSVLFPARRREEKREPPSATTTDEGPHLVTPVSGGRLVALDGLRGLAILLMVMDHAALVYGAPWGVREVVTRLAVPLFMLTAGYLWRPGLRRRHLETALAAVVATPLLSTIGGAEFGILVVFLLVLPLVPVAVRWPLPVLALCLLQLSTWQIPWYGYQPGFVLGLLVVGQLAWLWGRDREFLRAGELCAAFAFLGRWPLTLYVGHLAVLAIANTW